MPIRKACAATIILTCAVYFSTAFCQETSTYAFSIENVKIPNNEKVVSMEIKISSGSISSIQNVPPGWYFEINNDPSWQSTVKGNTLIGAASLSTNDLKKITFSAEKKEFNDKKFDIFIDVNTTADFNTEHTTTITQKDLHFH